jgi:hypothetical protein
MSPALLHQVIQKTPTTPFLKAASGHTGYLKMYTFQTIAGIATVPKTR